MMPAPPVSAPATAPGKTLAAWIGALVAAYGVTWVLTWGLWRIFVDSFHIYPTPLSAERVPGYALAFFLFFTPILYLLPCALARRWLRPNAATVVLYMGMAFFMGGGLELTMDPLWIFVLGRPCYLYHIFPVHDGYTSGFGAVMWPMYGFFVAMLHNAIEAAPARLGFLHGHWARAALLAVDAMLLEVAANVFSLLGYNSWLFRYHAPDLNHFTTIEAFPIYLLGGYVGVRLLHAAEAMRHRAVLGLGLYLVTAAVVLVA